MTIQTIATLRTNMPVGVTGGITAQDMQDFIDTVEDRTSQDINVQTGTTYTALLTDNRRRITLNNAASITFTIPNSVPVGWECSILQLGAGVVTVAVTGGSLRHLENNTKTAGQYAQAYLYCYANAGTAPQIAFSGQTSV